MLDECFSEILQNVNIDQGIHLGGKIKYHHEMKNEKNYTSFHIPKVWQILKRFTGAFH